LPDNERRRGAEQGGQQCGEMDSHHASLDDITHRLYYEESSCRAGKS
jgi:hypothetical protein